MVDYTTSKKKGFLSAISTPGRRRLVLAFAGVCVLCFVIIMSVLGATGVFKNESAPADVNNVSGSNGNETETPGVEVNTTSPTSSPETPTAVTTSPTYSPGTPTAGPTMKPTRPVTYLPGLLSVEENGLLMSQGLKSRIIARSGSKVPYADGTESAMSFHLRPDNAATFAVPDDATDNKGGWVYVSNSEMQEQGQGGVGAITFDRDGNVINYEMLLEGTTMNCAGGRTPWETWVSCEEVAEIGDVYQVDPFGRRPPEKLTLSTMQGGRYESFAYDDRNKSKPQFFVTEDQQAGPLRRYTPSSESVDWDNNPWDMLHGNGTLEYLVLTPDGNATETGKYGWVSSFDDARAKTAATYPGSEGVDRHDNLLYIATKTNKQLFIIDLDADTYVRSSTVFGLFDGEPDQMQRLVNGIDDIVYFNEDQGVDAGIHGRNMEGQFFTILEAPGWGVETTGLAWDPSGKYMYFALQEDGVLFEVNRIDGYPFQGMTLDVRYHNQPVGASL